MGLVKVVLEFRVCGLRGGLSRCTLFLGIDAISLGKLSVPVLYFVQT